MCMVGVGFGAACKCFSALHKLVSGPGPIGALRGLPLHYVAKQKLSTDADANTDASADHTSADTDTIADSDMDRDADADTNTSADAELDTDSYVVRNFRENIP